MRRNKGKTVMSIVKACLTIAMRCAVWHILTEHMIPEARAPFEVFEPGKLNIEFGQVVNLDGLVNMMNAISPTIKLFSFIICLKIQIL